MPAEHDHGAVLITMMPAEHDNLQDLELSMTNALLQRLADGRTDLVFDILAAGLPATTVDASGTSLIQWCAYYGDVSAMRFLLAHGESLDALGDNLDLNGAAFHGHWRLCQFLVEQGIDSISLNPDTVLKTTLAILEKECGRA